MNLILAMAVDAKDLDDFSLVSSVPPQTQGQNNYLPSVVWGGGGGEGRERAPTCSVHLFK